MKKLAILLVVIPLSCLVALKAAAILSDLVTVPDFFYGVSPLLVVSVLAGGMAFAAFVLGVLTDDYSWVDRLWSTAPVAFAWVYTVRAGFDPQVTAVAVLVSLWGARLTFNFARRGGYTSMEDYRWQVLRTRIDSPVLWTLFNLLFICTYQVSLFVLFTLPIYAISLQASATLSSGFVAGMVAFVGFLAYETVADQQQWSFQRAKWGITNDAARFGGDIARGFLTTGLFRMSRHPNYFGEVMVWWTVYYLLAVASGHVFHWSGVGALLLSLLFIGSTRFTESITASKYPEYREFQKRTSAIIPWSPGRQTDQDVRSAESR